jgi:hypothetical protein
LPCQAAPAARDTTGVTRRVLAINYDVDAFPAKRDDFRYDEPSFREMWNDKKKAHKRTNPIRSVTPQSSGKTTSANGPDPKH